MADYDENEEFEELNGPGAPSGAGRRTRFRGGMRKFVPKVRVCALCVDRNARLDYKQPEGLQRYLSDRGKIRPRRQTGMCAKHQRRLAQAIKRARHLALLPFIGRMAR